MPCLSLRIVPRVSFAPASASPTSEGRATIAEAAKMLHEDPRVRLVLEGHRNPEEPAPLSHARAARVEADLVAAGIDPDRLCLADHGAARPLVSIDAPTRAANGRVDFRVLEEGEVCDDPGL
jgi:outer membrane protein OmpA-like peptidoglycan-associated protein